jgi:hypothetical protein
MLMPKAKQIIPLLLLHPASAASILDPKIGEQKDGCPDW